MGIIFDESRCSSVVERTLGKGEVESPILSSGTFLSDPDYFNNIILLKINTILSILKNDFLFPIFDPIKCQWSRFFTICSL